MASFPDREAGYATVVFGAIAFGLAMIAAAVLARSSAELRLAKREAIDVVADIRLEGAIVLAADGVLSDGGAGPFAWKRQIDGREILLLAEPEAAKLSASATTPHATALLRRLGRAPGSGPVETLRPGGSLREHRRRFEGSFKGDLGRTCAQSLVSILSTNPEPEMDRHRAPGGGGPNWRLGEIWRLAAFDGRRSVDAIVRFTGDPDAPIAVLDQANRRSPMPDIERCNSLIAEGQP